MAVLKLNSEELLSLFGLDDLCMDTAKLHTVANLNPLIPKVSITFIALVNSQVAPQMALFAIA